MDTAPVFQPTKSKYLVLTKDLLLPAFICLGVLSLVYLLLYSSVFQITSLSCSLDFEPCRSPLVLADLAKLKGQNIFLLNKQAITDRLESADFTIAEATIKRQLPGQIIVELESIYPTVALRIKDQLSWAVFDQELQLIAVRSIDPNVPTLIITTPLTLVIGQEPAEETIIHALQLTKRLGDELFNFKSLELLDQDTLELTLSDGTIALLSPNKDESEQISVLQAILSGGTMMDEGRIIDIRFSQPVLRP